AACCAFRDHLPSFALQIRDRGHRCPEVGDGDAINVSPAHDDSQLKRRPLVLSLFVSSSRQDGIAKSAQFTLR
ncbi:MAG TPA: hypothetical protein VN805_15440, partial [Caulobacteraceae bacterium]|nr:hypothetical protein [Caulobacteraceae bacterium]